MKTKDIIKKHDLNDDLNEFINELSQDLGLEKYKIAKAKIGRFINKNIQVTQ